MAKLFKFPVRPLAPLFLVGIALPACGGDGDGGNGGTPPSSTTITKGFAESGDAQIGTVGQPLAEPIQVLVTEDGVAAPGVTVTWSSTATGASLAATSTTNDEGVASNSWTLGTVSGPQTAQASLSGATGSPVTFTATAGADVATTLSEAGGNQQVGPINSELPDQLSVKASDQYGNGVPGVGVDWATTGDAELSAPSVITDGTGTSAVGVVLGGTEGPITITATSEGLSGSPVTFTATAGPAAPSTATVNVVNNQFQPAALTVPVGTTVTWRWGAGASNHNVAPVATEPPRSGSPQNAPNTYAHQFDTPGTYIYYCEVHGTPTGGMRGTITVQ